MSENNRAAKNFVEGVFGAESTSAASIEKSTSANTAT